MLGFFGLIGVLMGGVAADIFMSAPKGQGEGPNDDADAATQDADFEGADGADDMMDWTEPAMSDDLPDAPGPAQMLVAGDGGAILTGDGGDDTILGGAGDDQLGGRGGADLIEGGAGRDQVTAGAGDDTVSGGAGDDVLRGEDGDDTIFGGAGDDALYGHDGADSLVGDAGADSLWGGSGDDRLLGGAGDDWLTAGFDNDLLVGGDGSDTLDGDFGNDTLVGYEAQTPDTDVDFLNGGEGDDLLVVGHGDYATGNQGADTFALGDWLTEGEAAGEAARIQDYDAAEDEIVVVYDPAAHPNPVLTLRESEGSDDATLLLDGLPLAVVQGGAGLDLGLIRLSASAAA